MQIRRRCPAVLAAALLITASLAGSASGTPTPPVPSQQAQLDRACEEAVANFEQAVKADGQVQAIHTDLQVVTPGSLTGKIAFNPSGNQISVAGDRGHTSLGCGMASASGARGAGGSGGSRVVSTLHRRFTTTGRYALTFTLNPAARQILARLAAADKAYFKQHPHGQQPPALGFGVSLSYSPAGREPAPARARSTSSRTPKPVAPLSA